jgi:5'-3' exonuclease
MHGIEKTIIPDGCNGKKCRDCDRSECAGPTPVRDQINDEYEKARAEYRALIGPIPACDLAERCHIELEIQLAILREMKIANRLKAIELNTDETRCWNCASTEDCQFVTAIMEDRR